MSSSRIITPFGAQSTAAEVFAGVDMSGRRAIVTGASSGIGVETARALASAGAEVTLAVRNLEAGRHTAEDIAAGTGSTRVLVAPLDLADQGSVAAFAAGWDGPLHILVNNAGIMATPEMRTPQGWEISSPPTIWATSPWPPACTTRSPQPAEHAWWWSARSGTSTARSCSTTSTSSGTPTIGGRPTASPKPPTSCSWSRRPGGENPTRSP